jgi:3',5'-cyclic AMP phosphodiesterase CpdA
MIKFIHVSDLHFHRSDADNRPVAAVLAGIREEFFVGDPHAVLLVTGDITDDGHPEQYAQARQALIGFGPNRVLACPGNHDYGPAGLFYSPSRGRRFDSDLAARLGTVEPYFTKDEPSVTLLRDRDGDRVMALGLNGVLETTTPIDFSCGEVGHRQLAALDATLANPASRAIPKIVYVHFHPFMHADPTMRLRDADALVRVLEGRIQVLCFGHRHVEGCWSNRAGIPHILAAPAAAETRHVWSISFQGTEPPTVQRELVLSLESGRAA